MDVARSAPQGAHYKRLIVFRYRPKSTRFSVLYPRKRFSKLSIDLIYLRRVLKPFWKGFRKKPEVWKWTFPKAPPLFTPHLFLVGFSNVWINTRAFFSPSHNWRLCHQPFFRFISMAWQAGPVSDDGRWMGIILLLIYIKLHALHAPLHGFVIRACVFECIRDTLDQLSVKRELSLNAL